MTLHTKLGKLQSDFVDSVMTSRMLDSKRYHLDRLKSLPGPRLVVYREQLDQNIRQMRDYLEEIIPGSDFEHLMPHAKTHKSRWVAQKLIEEGVSKFKSSFNELDTLLEAGAQDIFVAYPALAHDADKLARRIRQYPQVRLSGQIGCRDHAECLQAAASTYAVTVQCFLDLDVGNRRTGIGPERLLDLARVISRDSAFSRLQICGLHAYDGHNQSSNPGERRELARQCMEQVAKCWQALMALGVDGERVVVSGTPPFRADLRELAKRHKLKAQVMVSPGTWIYWDTKYDGIIPGLFEFAALILAQVIDLPGDNLVTLNLGYKRWAIDQGPVELFSTPGLEFVSAAEEHTVLRRTPSAPRLRVGDSMLIAPRHVCATVNLWEEFTLVGEDGRVLEAALPVSARNR